MQGRTKTQQRTCFHCGQDCPDNTVQMADKYFCCEGCRMVYGILQQHQLCDYYTLNNNPGFTQKIPVRKDKFNYLDDPAIKEKLIAFTDGRQTHVIFYLPQIHCSSCLWLLENLHKLSPGITDSRVHFSKKEITIRYDESVTTLRKVAEALTAVGYEPYISLQDTVKKKGPATDRRRLYRLVVAGVCFSVIMMLSLPEYISGGIFYEKNLGSFFRYINLLFALPAFFFSGAEFFVAAWKGVQRRFLNIDAPIALAILITFGRSLYEIIGGSGAGYLDSMSGIIFFMLLGRILQERTYLSLAFDRDYTAYFPVAVTRVEKDGVHTPVALPQIQPGDTLLIHHGEIVPADGILTRGRASIDYSFVSGESVPVEKEMGEIIYAGGKQLAANMEILVIKAVSQSYLTDLWNKDAFKKNKTDHRSFIHTVSRYFTLVLFSIAAVAALYWYFRDPSQIGDVVTAVLIVACPCALLLSATFTNGNILRLFSKRGLYLRSADVIETMATANHIVFDKTGTLTNTRLQAVQYEGRTLTDAEKQFIASVAAASTHPLSKAIAASFPTYTPLVLHHFKEYPGKGIEGWLDKHTHLKMGSEEFVYGQSIENKKQTGVFVMINLELAGVFNIDHRYRSGLRHLIRILRKKHYGLSLLSGDHDHEARYLQGLLGDKASLHFRQQPADKLHHIRLLQQRGKKVMMLGDGLNDAGALQQSDVGIAITESTNNFSPACDAIMEAGVFTRLYPFIRMAKAGKKIIIASFILSILYNIIGLGFAVQGGLSPMVAAILMPASSISIIVLTYGLSAWLGKKVLDER
jgi:P-type Cu+ transporter